MANEDHDILLEIRGSTRALHDELLGPDRKSGRIPKLEETQDEHARQLAYWKGAIAVVGFVLLVFGAVLAEHVFASGK